MMLQTLIVWAIVAFAAWHVGKRLYAMIRGFTSKNASSAACGNCVYAPTESEKERATFVPLSTITIQH